MTTTKAPPGITDAQRKVLSFVAGCIAKDGFGPTVREIGKHFGYSENGVACHLRPLRRKGALTWLDGQARTLRVTDDGYAVLRGDA